jgi:hypothetical protein
MEESSMSKSLIAVVLGLSMPLISTDGVRADPEECRDAVHKFQTATTAVDAALSVYGACVGYSHGRDECSNAFYSLQSAQQNFEYAVWDYKDDCR